MIRIQIHEFASLDPNRTLKTLKHLRQSLNENKQTFKKL